MSRWVISCVVVMVGVATPLTAQRPTPDSVGATADTIAVHVLAPLVVRGRWAGHWRYCASERLTNP